MTGVGCRERNASSRWRILDKLRVTSEVAEFGMRVGCEPLGVLHHVLNTAVGSVGGSVVHVDRLQLDVERRHVTRIKTDNIFPN